VLALLVAYAVTTLILVLAGDPAGEVWAQILSWPADRNLINIINAGSVYYLSGLAVAIGFRMNLFNIGVDGQYRIAAFVAAVIAGEAWLPGYLNTALAVVAAMLVGAAWAGIAGLLRVTRGVSEVISTIMLNAISTALVAFLLRKWALKAEGSNDIGTTPIPEGSRIPGFSIAGVTTEIYGFVIVAGDHGRDLLRGPQPNPLRLRPARDRPLGDGRDRERRERQADDRHLDAAVRCRRGPGRSADPVR
jgi:simple sugar transport system permease protein